MRVWLVVAFLYLTLGEEMFCSHLPSCRTGSEVNVWMMNGQDSVLLTTVHNNSSDSDVCSNLWIRHTSRFPEQVQHDTTDVWRHRLGIQQWSCSKVWWLCHQTCILTDTPTIFSCRLISSFLVVIINIIGWFVKMLTIMQQRTRAATL